MQRSCSKQAIQLASLVNDDKFAVGCQGGWYSNLALPYLLCYLEYMQK